MDQQLSGVASFQTTMTTCFYINMGWRAGAQDDLSLQVKEPELLMVSPYLQNDVIPVCACSSGPKWPTCSWGYISKDTVYFSTSWTTDYLLPEVTTALSGCLNIHPDCDLNSTRPSSVSVCGWMKTGVLVLQTWNFPQMDPRLVQSNTTPKPEQHAGKHIWLS